MRDFLSPLINWFATTVMPYEHYVTKLLLSIMALAILSFVLTTRLNKKSKLTFWVMIACWCVVLVHLLLYIYVGAAGGGLYTGVAAIS